MADDETVAAELPLDRVGARLARARQAAKLTIQQIADSTKIPSRHLEAIEAGNYAALPARTYAVGFSRTYARAVGLDEQQTIAAVRQELAEIEPEAPRRAAPTFEPGDPARVPSAGFAWALGLGALAVLIAGFVFWRSYYVPAGELPSLLADETPAASAAPAAPASAAPAASGPVVFTALEPGIWVKFYDGAGQQLLQKQLAQGETYTVPADQSQVLIWTARPDALAITVGGQPVPKLADVQRTVKDVPVTAAALLARTAPADPATGPAAAPTSATVAATGRPQAAASARPRDRGTPTRSAERRAQPAVTQAAPTSLATAAAPAVAEPAVVAPAAPATAADR